ncbi:MAG: PAC2 family protein [Desertimonas sp.]
MSDPPGVDEVLTLHIDTLTPLRAPVLVVALTGWFDVAGVATTALERLAPEGRAVTIGEIDPDPFYDFTQERPLVEITDDDLPEITWPSNTIRAVRTGDRHDLVVLSGVEPHLGWQTYVASVRRIVEHVGCEAVLTLGANADTVPHTRVPLVVGSTADGALARAMALSPPTYQGVTGLLGVLNAQLGAPSPASAATSSGRTVPVVSLRVGVPHYLGHAEHPRAVGALLRHVAHVLGLSMSFDFTDEIERWGSLHDEAIEDDAQLRAYVAMLEAEYDRRARATLDAASGDDLAARFEEYLRDQRDDG